MIQKYLSFINESLELILESDVKYSDNFRRILSKINTPIAQKLIEIENTDLPVRSNFFDIIPDKNDKVSFLDDRRAQEMLSKKSNKVKFSGSGGWLKHSEANKEIFDILGYTYGFVDTARLSPRKPYEPNSTDIGEIVAETVSPTSGNTYCWVKFSDESGQELGQGVYNKTRLQDVDNSKKEVWQRGRQEIGVGRGIRAILTTTGEKFLDKDIEQFVNLYKAEIDKFNDKFRYFEVVSGDDIAEWYEKDKYYNARGTTLGNSCMASAPHKWLEIYTKNPNQCEMVIYKTPEDEEKIIGRALLWTLDDGKKFMDRIYYIKDSDIQLYREFAKQNGWYVKYHNSSTSSPQSIAPDGTIVNLRLKVTLDRKYYDNYPYLDTLKYFTPGSGVLNNTDGELELEDTGGGHSGSSCDYCGGSGMVECGNCYGGGTEDCGDCRGRGTIDCNDCDGEGHNDCENCDGTGHVEDDEGNEVDCDECGASGVIDCSSCDGDGDKECENCGGSGEVECGDCDGSGEVSCFECS